MPFIPPYRHHHAPGDPPDPANGGNSTPPNTANSAFTQTCCGNILITGDTPGVLIWERDASLRVSAVQATVYARPENTEPIRLLIEADELLEMDVAPGNTVNYLGHRIRRLRVTVPGAGPATFAEGKYAVTVNG
ncbi:MAG: hypothetical protein C6W55_07430 [Thermobacillus sp.]|uniref:S-Ena type endospore appendage n=1 Tax=Thermobacillus sp. TaxID=2108467 RepID=UPI000E39C07F|nr:S-Ena type endospore appendage [Thermobacillus sp.]REK56571.1 MAG: hypothetical protein C6W55_07430 [Thermobacillus sp.]